jgi:hypothetical protein
MFHLATLWAAIAAIASGLSSQPECESTDCESSNSVKARSVIQKRVSKDNTGQQEQLVSATLAEDLKSYKYGSPSGTTEKAESNEGESSQKNTVDLNLKQEAKQFKEKYGRYEIRSHNSASAHTQETKWILSFPRGCTSSGMAKFEEGMRHYMKEDFKSDSKENKSICVLMVNGTKSSLKKWIDHTTSLPTDVTIEEDSSQYPDTSMNADAKLTVPWGLDRIDSRSNGLDGIYSSPLGLTGKGVHVFIMDTGIRTTHTDFEGRALKSFDATSGKPVECDGTDDQCASDTHWHGTHCAGTIGGNTFGVATESTLHSLKVLNPRGWISWQIEAFAWVMDNDALRPGIVSMSLGNDKGGSQVSEARESAINTAVSSGIVVVVAAGNDDFDACNKGPAYIPSVITVGATDLNDKRASFSNYGTCVDIFAPGRDIVSAGASSDVTVMKKSGTSMACPHVSGVAALFFQEDPTRTAAELEQILKKRATPNVVSDTKGSPNLFLHNGLDVPKCACTGYGNKMVCNNGEKRACSVDHECFAQDAFPYGEWQLGCKPAKCKCTGDGNKMVCNTGEKRACSVDHECYAQDAFPYGEWDLGCKPR